MTIPQYCLDRPDLYPTCPNYDPCFFVLPIEDAEWDMVDSNASRVDSAIAFVIDTTWSRRSSRLYFRPRTVYPNAIYRWQLGTDPRIWEVRDFNPGQGFFNGFEGPIEVQLEIIQPDTAGCLMATEATKTFSKTIHLVDFPGWEVYRYPVVGSYTGQYFDDTGSPISDIAELAIQTGEGTDYNIYLTGAELQFECNLFGDPGVRLSGNLYQQVSTITGQSSVCYDTYRPVILTSLDQENGRELTIDFWHTDPETNERIYRQFIGQKVE
ncbi:MAG: hypothetical protein AAF741_19175 [Bacteroidota bacterium]